MPTGLKLRRALPAILVVLVGAIVVILLTSRGSAPSSSDPVANSKFDGPTMPSGLRAHDFSLVDQYGRRVTLDQYRGRVVVLTFIHSRCHDTCPFMVEQIKGALNQLPDRGRGIPAIGISVAPGEDTAANRKRFLARHEMTGRLEFLSGPMPAMRRVWRQYAMQPVTPKIDHSTFVLLIDKQGIERIGYAADQLAPEDLAHDIRVLQDVPA